MRQGLPDLVDVGGEDAADEGCANTAAVPESDDEEMPSMLAVLKSRYTTHASSSDPKGKSTKVQGGEPSTRPKPKAQRSTRTNPAPHESAPVTVSGSNRKRKAPPAATVSEGEVNRQTEEDEPSTIAACDQEVFDAFDEKLKALYVITPPKDDANFKEYMTDHLSKLNNLAAELRVKKKSVGRRRNKQDDPLHAALLEFENKIKDMTLLNKRALTE